MENPPRVTFGVQNRAIDVRGSVRMLATHALHTERSYRNAAELSILLSLMLYHNVMVTAQYRRVIDTILVGAAAILVWSAGHQAGLWDPELTRRGAVVFLVSSTSIFTWLGARFQVYQARRTEHLRRELHALAE